MSAACLAPRSCPTLRDSVDCSLVCSPQAPLSMGLSRQEYWSGLPSPSPGDPPNQGSSLHLLCLLPYSRFFTP